LCRGGRPGPGGRRRRRPPPLLDVPERQNVRLSQFREEIAFDPKLLLGIVAAGFTYVGAEMTLNIWLPKLQLDVFGASDTWASLSVTLFWVGLIAGRLTVMRMTHRYSPARLLMICAGVLAVFAVGLATAPSQAVSLVLAVGAGLGASASYGLIGSYAGRFPGWKSAVATSLFILSGAWAASPSPISWVRWQAPPASAGRWP
jgi:FHS family glucose/mannose:H+ symporter-like MFS transporter